MPERVGKRLCKKLLRTAPAAMALGCLLGLGAGTLDPAGAASLPSTISGSNAAPDTAFPPHPFGVFYAKRPDNREDGFPPFSGPQDRRRMPPEYQEWQSMPPQEKDALRRRLEEYRNLPPQQQELYKQRYRQWQQIPPEDRQRIESDIQRWNELSPAQREAIRRLFNR